MSNPSQEEGISVRLHGAEPTRLTSSQKSRVRKEFRAAYLINNESQRHHAINGVYFKFEEMYGVSRDQLREIVKKVKREHRQEQQRPYLQTSTGVQPKPQQQPMTCGPRDPMFRPQRGVQVPMPPTIKKPQPRKQDKLMRRVSAKGRAGVCSYCGIGVPPVGSSLCGTCTKKGHGKKLPAQSASDHRQRSDSRRGQCPFCSKVVPPKADGHLRSHKNKTGSHCVGSGGLPIGAKTTRGGGGSVRTVSGGLPGLGKRR